MQRLEWPKLRRPHDKNGALIGMVLGDACLHIPKGRVNAVFRFEHGSRQKAYAHWKAELVRRYIFPDIKLYEQHRRGTTFWVAVTRAHRKLTHLYRDMYRNGVKVIRPNILHRLTPLGLALWYMDDGSLVYCRNPNGSIASRQMYLSTACFTEAEHDMMADYFLEYWGIRLRKGKQGKHWKMWANTEDTLKFFDIIRPYVLMVPGMWYKICPRYERYKHQFQYNVCGHRCAGHLRSCPYEDDEIVRAPSKDGEAGRNDQPPFPA